MTHKHEKPVTVNPRDQHAPCTKAEAVKMEHTTKAW